jgi:antitoxin ParD1/3/4
MTLASWSVAQRQVDWQTLPNRAMLVPNRMERAMATMNVSLPDQMKEWVEAQAESGRYANASDYVRDLIRRDQEKAEKIAHWTRLVEEARASGVSERTPEQLFNDIVSGALRR